jgi:hypothetical protein
MTNVLNVLKIFIKIILWLERKDAPYGIDSPPDTFYSTGTPRPYFRWDIIIHRNITTPRDSSQPEIKVRKIDQKHGIWTPGPDCAGHG